MNVKTEEEAINKSIKFQTKNKAKFEKAKQNNTLKLRIQ